MNRNDEGNELLETDGVQEGQDCPDCGERRVDYLLWNNLTAKPVGDADFVECQTCGCVYVP